MISAAFTCPFVGTVLALGGSFPKSTAPISPTPYSPEVGATAGMQTMKDELTTLRIETLAIQAVLTMCCLS
jgi:hypothetical protein